MDGSYGRWNDSVCVGSGTGIGPISSALNPQRAREVWLIDFAKRTVAIYRLCGDRYEPPTILALEGVTPLAAVPGAIIHWDPIVARIRKSQND